MSQLNTAEFFSGNASFSKVAKQLGHNTLTHDIDPLCKPDILIDFMDIKQIPDHLDFIWLSPPCEACSIASCRYHWLKFGEQYFPKSKKAVDDRKLWLHILNLLSKFKGKWVIENPRGMRRKMPYMEGIRRYTVTYSSYEYGAMKPTDLWCNFEMSVRPLDKNGSDKHVPAPRGSKTGTQGKKSYLDRSHIPAKLIEEILEQVTNDKQPSA